MPGERSILVIDDDAAICAALAEQLAVDREFHPVTVGSLAEADSILAAQGVRFCTVILDVSLPDGDGREYCAKLRRHGLKIPIIMLTGSDDEMDVVRCLDAGANDYLTKPFRLHELKARIRTQLRRFEASDDAVFTVGPYLFRPSERSLVEQNSNRRIRLTIKEVALLKFLHRAGERVVDRQELLNQVWGYNTAAKTHTLETHIYRLRQRIEWDPNQPRLLVTHRHGYRLRHDGDAPETARETDRDIAPEIAADHAVLATAWSAPGTELDRPAVPDPAAPL